MTMDIDTMTNVILNNPYDLKEEIKNSNGKKPKKGKNKSKKKKTKKSFKKLLFKLLKTLIVLFILGIIFLFLFFKTSLFQKYKELWVQTAMSTMNHQYLATWFLSDEEIAEIMQKLAVENSENSDPSKIKITNKSNEIKVEKITGKNYVGYVMIIGNPGRVQLVDSRQKTTGTQLSQIVKEKGAIAGINAGGFADDGGHGKGNKLVDAVIIDKKLVNGDTKTRYSLIGLSKEGKLILGKYTYQEAINAGIKSAVEFGPFLIVNGNKQIKNENSGGIQPRMAIGQKRDGTLIFVSIDGRQPGYSLGATLLELQSIFEKYGAYNAANLDGGSSATMYYENKLVNKPSTPMGERYLPNAFIVKNE